jgi:hypothetical protein
VAGRGALLGTEPVRLVGELLVAPRYGGDQLGTFHEDEVRPDTVDRSYLREVGDVCP